MKTDPRECTKPGHDRDDFECHGEGGAIGPNDDGFSPCEGCPYYK